jgi:hypothetical protein
VPRVERGAQRELALVRQATTALRARTDRSGD